MGENIALVPNFSKHRDYSILQSLRVIGIGVGAPIIATILIVVLFENGVSLNAIPIFFVFIMLAAATSGVKVAVISAVSAFFMLSALLLQPRFNLQFVSNDDFVNLLIFFIAALITGYLSGLARDKGLIALERAQQVEALFDAASQVLTCRDAKAVHQVILVAAERITPQDWYIVDEDGAALQDAPMASLGSPIDTGGSGHTIPIRDPEKPSLLRARSARSTSPETQKSLVMLAKLAEGALARIRVQRDLENAKVTAASDTLRTTILNSVAHDLRTPLSSIAASAATLEAHGDAISGGEKIQLVRSIRISSERLGRFITKLLTSARIESGPVKAQLEFIEVHDLVGGVLDAFSQQQGKSAVQWDGSGAEYEIYCDPVLLDQAMYNIIENCLDYTPASEPVRVSVSTGDYLSIQIADSGPGIAPEMREQVFERWIRGHQPTRARTGLGLGLSISRGFVRAIGGEVLAKDKPDGSSGACFEIRFPMNRVRGRHEC